MLREDCKVGMKVTFGRPNGAKTLGEVVKLNDKKAKVKTLEARGVRDPAGAEWGVPYSMLTQIDGDAAPQAKPISPKLQSWITAARLRQTVAALDKLATCAKAFDDGLHAGRSVAELSAEQSRLYNAINEAREIIAEVEIEKAGVS